MTTLCLDYGERYVGVAMTDRDGRLALRHSVIDQKQQDALAVLRDLIATEAVEKILVGVPVGLSGQETVQTRVSLKFIEQLRSILGGDIVIESVDETLTSVEAAQRLAAEGGPLSRKASARQGKHEEHMEAARLMLEQYLQNYD